MSLNIRPSTSDERRLLFIETLINLSTKVTKVSNNSVLSGIAGGVSKIAGKAEKDIILAVSQMFPDSAYGTSLDQTAFNFGIAPRLGTLGSATYVRLVAVPGTTYLASTNLFQSIDGQVFQLTSDVTINSFGFTYALVQSQLAGSVTNVNALTISSCSPAPNGHASVINEYQATGGRDVEDDNTFRQRIKGGVNILARGTLSMLEQLFILINNKVLKIYNQGYDNLGQLNIGIATQNGAPLTTLELTQLLTQSQPFFGLSEYKPYGNTYYGIKLNNITYQPFDMSFRCDIDPSYNPDQVRIAIQTAISKYIDFRTFNPLKQSIQWTNLFSIVQNTAGVNYVYDNYFAPQTDIVVQTGQLPRLRSFLMLNATGSVLSNLSGSLSPIYYPNVIDYSYRASILGSLT